MPETDFGGSGHGTPGAHCAIHLDQPATRTCTRCGSFMCAACSEGGAQPLCPACQQRLGVGQGFPLNRANWSFSALWDYSFEIFKRDWLMISVACLVFIGISFMVQLIANLIPMVGAALDSAVLSGVLMVAAVLVQNLVQGVLALGLLRMLMDMLQGGKADIGRIFSQIHKVGTYLVTMLLVIVVVGLPIVLLVGIVGWLNATLGRDSMLVGIGIALMLGTVPVLYLMLPLALIQYELAYNDGATPMQVIRNCYAYARDERLSILGIAIVAFLVGLVGLVACCVGVIPAMGLGYLLMGGLYLSLRTGADVEG
jgi:hypothetical protein